MNKFWLILKRSLVVMWFLVLAVLGAWITDVNKTMVAVDYILFEPGEQRLGVVVSQVLFVGVIIGYLTNILTSNTKVFWHKRRYKKAAKDLEKLKMSQQG